MHQGNYVKEDFLRSYNILQNKLYFQKLLFAIVAILTALILLTLPTLHDVLKVTLFTILNIAYNATIAITLQRVVQRRAGE